MKWYIWRPNPESSWRVERRSSAPKGEWHEANEEFRSASMYVEVMDEDGTCSIVPSEQKRADIVDKERAREYELSKQK